MCRGSMKLLNCMAMCTAWGLHERVTYSLVLDTLMQDVDVAIKLEDKLSLSVREN